MLTKTWIIVYFNHLGCNYGVLATISSTLRLPQSIKKVWNLLSLQTQPDITHPVRAAYSSRFDRLLTVGLSAFSWLPKMHPSNHVKVARQQGHVVMSNLFLSPRAVWYLHWSKVKKNSAIVGWSFFITEFSGYVIMYLHKAEPGQPMRFQFRRKWVGNFQTLVDFATQEINSMTWNEQSVPWPEGPSYYAQISEILEGNTTNAPLFAEHPFYAEYLSLTQKY